MIEQGERGATAKREGLGMVTRKVLELLGVAAMAPVFLWQLTLLSAFEASDWRHFYHYYDWIRITLTTYGVLPLFMADAIHSTNFVANPQSPVFGPLVWLLYFLPTAAYIKLLVIGYTAVGLVGMYGLLRDHDVNPEIAFLGGAVFAFNGFFLSHFAIGHHCFMALPAMPALLFLYCRATRGSVGGLVGATILNVMVLFEGSHHPFLWQNAFIALYATSQCLAQRGLGPARVWLVFLAASLGLGSVKLVPMFAEFASYAPDKQIPALSFGAALWSLVARGQNVRTTHSDIPFLYGAGWWEYCFYIGWLALIAIVIGVAAGARRARLWLLPAGFFLVMSLDLTSIAAWLDPWHWVHELPLWRSQRAPARFLLVANFGFMVVAGLGLQSLVERSRQQPRLVGALRVALAVVAALVTLDLYAASISWQKLGPGLRFRERDHRPLLRVADRSEGEWAQLVDFAPHRFVVEVHSQRGSLVIFPLEPADALDEWRADGGRLEQAGGRLALRVPPGTSRIALSFRPRYFRTSLAISVATVLSAAAALSRRSAREHLSRWLRFSSGRSDPG